MIFIPFILAIGFFVLSVLWFLLAVFVATGVPSLSFLILRLKGFRSRPREIAAIILGIGWALSALGLALIVAFVIVPIASGS